MTITALDIRREGFGKLPTLLDRIERKFFLSLNDRPEIREIFGKFQFESAEYSYSRGEKNTLGIGIAHPKFQANSI